MSAAVFERFRRHDWAQDVNFLMGLANIQQKWAPEGLSPAQLKERVQQVQAFYFDKYVERLDYAAFLADEAKRQEDLLFERFLSHDFAGDARYQSLVGDLVSKLRDGGQHAADQIDKEITLFKCTYFSENVAPINVASLQTRALANAAASPAATADKLTCPFGFKSSNRGPSTGQFTAPIGQVPAGMPAHVAKMLAMSSSTPSAPPPQPSDAPFHLSRTASGMLTVAFPPPPAAFLDSPLATCRFGNAFLDESKTASAALLVIPGPPRTDPADLDHLETGLNLIGHVGTSSLPIVTCIDGHVSGLAASLFLSGAIRIVTPLAAVVLPPSLIGCLAALCNLRRGVAVCLGLSGRPLFAADLVASGLATHCVAAERLREVCKAAAAAAGCPFPHTAMAIEKTVDDMAQQAGPSRLRTFAKEIDEIFGADDVTFASLTAALSDRPAPFFADALYAITSAGQPRVDQLIQHIHRIHVDKNNAHVVERELAKLSAPLCARFDENSVSSLVHQRAPTSSMDVALQKFRRPLTAEQELHIVRVAGEAPCTPLERPLYPYYALAGVDFVADVRW